MYAQVIFLNTTIWGLLCIILHEALIDNLRGEAEEVIISGEGMHDKTHYGGILNIS